MTANLATTIGVYRPAAADRDGERVLGWDEDSTTLAAEAARLAIRDGDVVSEITVVSRSPTYLIDDAGAVLARALDLQEVDVTQIRGGGPAVLAALASAAPGTIVVAIDTDKPVGAAAVLMRSEASRPVVSARHSRSLPYRVRRSGSDVESVYDDERLIRERAWRPAVEALASGPAIVTGIPSTVASRLGGLPVPELDEVLESSWAALTSIAYGDRVVAIDGASGVAVEARSADFEVSWQVAPTYVSPTLVPGPGIPISLSAYERAFDAKVGLTASRCSCGSGHFPPRDFCPECGQRGMSVPEPLSHRATVYSIVTVRVPIPSLPSAYSLAVVDIEGSDLRALVPVTGAAPGTAVIGDRGELVLRRVAERDGVPDYGYAFRGDRA
jgi:uncharacterized OB-fold protein